jgi:ABC-2 type transport system ATP-binding protein
MVKKPPPLEARDLVHRYGQRVALELAELRVESGQGVGLLGPNGSGKSTLLNILAGVLDPERGEVRVCGEPVSARAARLRLGFVPQDVAVYEDLRVEENARLFGRLCGLRGAALDAAVERALEVGGLLELRREMVHALSGGTRRRLSIACALVHEPAVLLLDEPFAGIDDGSRRNLLALLEDRKRAGLALVISTHRLEELSSLCDRTLALSDGRLQAASRSLTPGRTLAAGAYARNSLNYEGVES